MERIELNGKEIRARELTVAEMDAVLKDLSSGETHPIERVFSEEPITAKALELSLDTSAGELLTLPCQQLASLIEQVKTENPFFVARMERLATILLNMAKEAEATAEMKEAPSSDFAGTSAG